MTTPRRLPNPPSIEAITRLYDLEILAEEFEKSTGIAPELPSHWNPKLSISKQMATWLPPPPNAPNLVDYVYPGDVTLDDRIYGRLGENKDRGFLMTPSGTTSVVNVCSYLKNIGIRDLVVITPAYFTVGAIATMLGLSVSYVGFRWQDGRYHLPADLCGARRRRTAIWFTFPIYGTSVYFEPSDIASLIDEIPEGVVIVVDDSLSYLDRRSLDETRSMNRVLRICTPHKSLCINGEKVSFVTFPKHLWDDMDAWSDCFAGGIGVAGLRALSFVLSDAYDEAVAKARLLVRTHLALLQKMIARNSDVRLDSSSDGYFVTLYWPQLPASLGEQEGFLDKVLSESYALPIPSTRNLHPPECGFCFRINLFRLDDGGLGGVRRLIDAIGHHAGIA